MIHYEAFCIGVYGTLRINYSVKFMKCGNHVSGNSVMQGVGAVVLAKINFVFQKFFFFLFSFLLFCVPYRDGRKQAVKIPSHGKMSKFCPGLSCGKILSLSCCPGKMNELLPLLPVLLESLN